MMANQRAFGNISNLKFSDGLSLVDFLYQYLTTNSQTSMYSNHRYSFLILLFLLGHFIPNVADFVKFEELEKQIRSHPDLVEDYFPNQDEQKRLNQYKEVYPHPEDYSISLLVNPCGANGTHFSSWSEIDRSITNPYDCCVNRFGRGEYGLMKFDRDGNLLDNNEILEKHIPAHYNEVMHNMILVDEDNVPIPYEHSRRADDHLKIDESCVGLRDPHPSCLEFRVKAMKSPHIPSCWDHNQTIDSTLSCFASDGKARNNCMQIAYSQNAFFLHCADNGVNDGNCGTFIEIHKANGSPYDDEHTILAEQKIQTKHTNGHFTTTIDLTYKGDPNKILCDYQEIELRQGSMVKIKNDDSIVPQCCCPHPYRRTLEKGSIQCPMKRNIEGGPFADRVDTLQEELDRDRDDSMREKTNMPSCPHQSENEDAFFCVGNASDYFASKGMDVKSSFEYLIGDGDIQLTRKCDDVSQVESGMYSSADLEGLYEEKCPYSGEMFSACARLDSRKCKSSDKVFSFHGAVGKIVNMPSPSAIITSANHAIYEVSFNDGRTSYKFPRYMLELVVPESNYELWFVKRNRFEKLLEKRKGFKVIWPRCTFDVANNRYFPYAILNDEGEILDVHVSKEKAKSQ